MPTGITKRLGYGGSAVIDSVPPVQVLITGGNMSEADMPSYIEAFDILPDNTSKSKMLHADGVKEYTGSINFDVTEAALGLLTTAKLLKRRYSFYMGIHDGENQYVMNDCLLTTLTLNGAPAGLISASMSFMAKAGKSVGIVTNAYVLDYTATPTQQPLGYWWSGNTDVRDWTFTMNQAVESVYSNEDTMEPKYLKTGLISYSLDVTTYSELSHSSIIIATSSFTLTGTTTSKAHNFNGVTDLGMYNHSFATAANATAGSGGIIIT